MPAEELLFQPTPGFGSFYEPYLEHAKEHPAKMNMWLLEWLIRAFTKPGETVLDPMAGSGSTGVVAALHGRNAVQVELEKKFYNWMERAKENIKKNTAIRQKGWIKNILGDARRLSQLLREADVAITSPTYSEGIGHSQGKRAGHDLIGKDSFVGYYGDGSKNNIRNLRHGSIDSIITSPPYLKSADCGAGVNRQREGDVKIGCSTLGRTVKHPEAIDNTKEYGSIDAVITSPPYVESVNAPNNPERRAERMLQAGLDPKTIVGGKARCGQIDWQYGGSEGQIGKLTLGKVDAVITSPPYSESMTKRRKGYTVIPELAKTREMPQDTSDDNIANLSHGNIDAIVTSPPYQNALHDSLEKRKAMESGRIHDEKPGLPIGYSENADNIGNIKEHGSIDLVLTSPPYVDVERRDRSRESWFNEDKERQKAGGSVIIQKGYQGNPENIGNLSLGSVDAVITSPPYADGKKAVEIKPEEVEKYAQRWEENVDKRGWNSWGKSFHTPGRLKGIRSLRDGYSKSKENIGNLPLGNVDCCITSPPYEGSLEGTTRHTRGGIASRDPALAQTGSYATVMSFGVPVGYSPNKENIGNLKKETYLEAMFRVYGEMFRVLKVGGLAVIVVKPFIRNKKPVDLPYHTWLLMEKVGFHLARLYKLRLKQQSFWRINYYKKYSDVPVIVHEYVLVCQKPCSELGVVEPQISWLDFVVEMVARETVLKIGA